MVIHVLIDPLFDYFVRLISHFCVSALCRIQVSSRQKETSSTSGMRDTVETSALIEHRAKVYNNVPSH